MKTVVAIHSSRDMQPWIAYIQCIWQIFLHEAYCYFTRALAAIYLSGTVIISGSHLQWFNSYCVFFKQALAVKVFFKGIELQLSIQWMAVFLLQKWNCSHAFFSNWLWFYRTGTLRTLCPYSQLFWSAFSRI